MRNLTILACTVLFVLLGACQQESGLVSPLTPDLTLHVDQENQVASACTNTLTTAPLSELGNAFLQLLDAIDSEFGHFDEMQWIALESSDGMADFANAFVSNQEYSEIRDMFVNKFAQSVDLNGLDPTLNDLMEVFKIVENELPRENAQVQCFLDFQNAQLAVAVALSACTAMTVETGIGPLICGIVAAATTLINRKKFFECVANNNP